MASWSEIERSEPDLAAAARGYLEARKHLTLATLRRDGSPRISGTEMMLELGEAWLGSMPAAVKARDLIRDPRFALHSGSEDPPAWAGDAKLGGLAQEVTEPEEVERVMQAAHGHGPGDGGMHLFRLDVRDLAVVRLKEDRSGLVIESWSEERGRRLIERS